VIPALIDLARKGGNLEEEHADQDLLWNLVGREPPSLVRG
jgi:hypothetical protein